MGVLNHLIAPKRQRRKQLSATLRSPLGGLLLPQFDQLGHAASTLPVHGPTGSAWSRAYILGAACASLQQQDHAPATDRECFTIALTAFSLAYGEEDAHAILSATIAAAEAREPEVEDGLMQGAADLAMVASGESDTARHFVDRNAGDLTEIL